MRTTATNHTKRCHRRVGTAGVGRIRRDERKGQGRKTIKEGREVDVDDKDMAIGRGL